MNKEQKIWLLICVVSFSISFGSKDPVAKQAFNDIIESQFQSDMVSKKEE